MSWPLIAITLAMVAIVTGAMRFVKYLDQRFQKQKMFDVITATIKHNCMVGGHIPEMVIGNAYWYEFRQVAQAVTLSIRNADGSITTQPEMYLLWMEDDEIGITYYRPDGQVGEEFPMRITSIVGITRANIVKRTE